MSLPSPAFLCDAVRAPIGRFGGALAHGGGIALGHPLGMSGARIAMTAVHALRRSLGRRALATLCVGIGQGVALALERV